MVPGHRGRPACPFPSPFDSHETLIVHLGRSEPSISPWPARAAAAPQGGITGRGGMGRRELISYSFFFRSLCSLFFLLSSLSSSSFVLLPPFLFLLLLWEAVWQWTGHGGCRRVPPAITTLRRRRRDGRRTRCGHSSLVGPATTVWRPLSVTQVRGPWGSPASGRGPSRTSG